MTLQEVDSLKFGDCLCWDGIPYRYMEPAIRKAEDTWSQGHALWSEVEQRVYWIGGATWKLVERVTESKEGPSGKAG